LVLPSTFSVILGLASPAFVIVASWEAFESTLCAPMYVIRQFLTVVVTPVFDTVAVAAATTPPAVVSHGLPDVMQLVKVTICA
jgi:hypothetical protein